MSIVPRKIKKYANRKLYDLEGGRYLSMFGLSELVAGGARVEVTCDRTGLDVTFETLARALYERLKRRSGLGDGLAWGSAHESFMSRFESLIRDVECDAEPASRKKAKGRGR